MKGKRLEDETCTYYRKRGYAVEQTPYQRDGGVDVYASKGFFNKERLAIQCKDTPAVGVRVARELYGVMCSDPTITGGAIVTTGTFSKDCRAFCKQNGIDTVVIRLPSAGSGSAVMEDDGRAGCGYLLVILACAVAAGIALSSLGEHEVRYVQGPAGPAGPAGPPGERGDPGAAAPPTTTATVPPPPTTTALPTPIARLVYVGNTDGDGVFLRRTRDMADRIAAYPDGTPLVVLGPDTVAQGRTWKHVRTPDGRVGYVPAQYTV